MNLDPAERSAERPLECSECKKALATLYTVVDASGVVHTVMCSSCPQLERRLGGVKPHERETKGTVAEAMTCPNCGVSLTTVRSGLPLGCAQCYDTFSDYLVQDLTASNTLLGSLASLPKGSPLHKGRQPGQAGGISAASKLKALNQALADALSREDYEQAAWIRDQIKRYTERENGGQQ